MHGIRGGRYRNAGEERAGMQGTLGCSRSRSREAERPKITNLVSIVDRFLRGGARARNCRVAESFPDENLRLARSKIRVRRGRCVFWIVVLDLIATEEDYLVFFDVNGAGSGRLSTLRRD